MKNFKILVILTTLGYATLSMSKLKRNKHNHSEYSAKSLEIHDRLRSIK